MSGDARQRIRIERAEGEYRVELGGEQLAHSRDALLLHEAGYDPVVYFPLEDVDRERLSDSATRTHCPYKGDARYFAAGSAGARIDVAWYYPEPRDEVAAIAGHVAFYSDRVAIRRA